MCGRFAQYAPIEVSALAESALAEMDPSLDLSAVFAREAPRYNLAPTMQALVLARNAERRLEVKPLRWGLVPFWAKDVRVGSHGINARSETVAEKPMFRAAFQKRRCIVPMNGYFEWKVTEHGKQPYFIHSADDRALLCAGLWEAWRPVNDDEQEWLRTFTVITGSAGVVSGNIHDRQPVILPPDALGPWLDGSPTEAASLLQNLPEAALAYHPVSRAVGSPRNQQPELVAPVAL